MYSGISILPLLLIATTGASSYCPNGWVHYGSSCYHFSRDTEPMLLASVSTVDTKSGVLCLVGIGIIKPIAREQPWARTYLSQAIKMASWTNVPSRSRQTSCEHMGGVLVEIDSLAENDYLFGELKRLNNSIGAWLGLNDIQEETVWRWYGSYKPLTSTGFKNWRVGQPDSIVGGDQNCVAMSSDNGFWNDGPCHILLHYICEKSDRSGLIVG